MDFTFTERETYWRDRIKNHIDTYLRPRVADYKKEDATGERWKVLQVVEEEKARAKAAGLWNLFMPPQGANPHLDTTVEFDGPQLTNVEYALCAEEMGRVGFASEVFNCSAPDTGNMEVFHRYGTAEQKKKWLVPLMNGEIRSAFLMTEPAVASSDATNIETRMIRDGDEYVINGTKWWSSGLGDPRCKVAIVMGKTDTGAQKHQQQSQIIVPMDAPGAARGACRSWGGNPGTCSGRCQWGLRPSPTVVGCGVSAPASAAGAGCRRRAAGWPRAAAGACSGP